MVPIVGLDASDSIKNFSLVANRVKYNVYFFNLIVQMIVSVVTRVLQ